jgi:hypothetical protein
MPEHSTPDRPQLSAVILTDVVGSAAVKGQRQLRDDLYDLMDGVLLRRGFGLGSFPYDDTGDGLRLFVPLDRVQPTDVVDMFALGLMAELRGLRQGRTARARLRVRVAFDMGLVEPHRRSWTGEPLVRVARLINAGPLRRPFQRDPQLAFAAVVSDGMYGSVVRPGNGYITPESFRPIRVRVKEFDGRAWLLTPYPSWLDGSWRGIAA